MATLMLGVLKRTLSHKWLSWKLPIFLFRVGFITLMKIDSLINLMMSCPSLPIILKLSLLSWCLVSGLCTWRAPLGVPCISPQGHRCFSDVLLPTVYGCTLVTVNDTTCLFLRILVFWLDRHLFEGPVTFEMSEINSTLEGLVGAKFGPLDRRDVWAAVRGVLDKLTTYLEFALLILEPCTKLLLLLV